MQSKSCDTVATYYKPLCFKTAAVKKPKLFEMHQKAVTKLDT